MTSRDFCYWLQGFFEINGGRDGWDPGEGLRPDQVNMVRNHLALVFKHEIDPSYGDEKHQAELNAIHNKVEQLDKKIEKVDSKKPVHVPPPVYRC